MPQASDSSAWMSGCLSLTDGPGVMLVAALTAALASALIVALAAIARSQLDPRLKHRPCWSAGASTVALGGLIAASMHASRGVVGASVAGALLGSLWMRGCNQIRRPCLVAVLDSAMGLAVMAWGFARYLLSSSAQANVERVELYAAVFIGALIFATSATTFCKLRGTLPLKAAARPGHGVVNLFAILLCGWLGYGFATEQAQPLGLAALLAMSALASAIGVHLMLSREYSHGHDADHGSFMPVFAARCDGLATTGKRGLLAHIEWHGGEEQAWTLCDITTARVRAAAYRPRRDWHNSRSGKMHQRVCIRHRPARATASTSLITRR
jgi:H+-translocating NAD(P) transhydrogenase subunit beta